MLRGLHRLRFFVLVASDKNGLGSFGFVWKGIVCFLFVLLWPGKGKENLLKEYNSYESGKIY